MQTQGTIRIEKPWASSAFMVRWVKSGLDESEEMEAVLPLSFGRHSDNSIVLRGKDVSRHHAVIDWHENHVVLQDQGSTNGTFVNGKACRKIAILPGDRIEIGEYMVVVKPMDEEQTIVKHNPKRQRTVKSRNERQQTVKPRGEGQPVIKSYQTRPLRALPFCPETDQLQPMPSLAACTLDTLPALFNQRVISMRDLERTHMPLRECTYLTIGGGLGSFAWVDHLIICGADPSQVAAIGFAPMAPYGRYKTLSDNSQIPGYERLRSNSDACPDNIWGWPGYAVREMWHDLKQGMVSEAAQVGWRIFNEPLAETYTPRAQDVYDSIDREAERIGWDRIWREGRVEAIRKTDDERYVVLYSKPDPNGGPSVRMLMVTHYLHVAVGYAGVRFLPDLLAYRQRTGDREHVVNAYEDHEHLYQRLAKQGGTVLIRGRGIVASRIIQRIYEVREKRLRNTGRNDIRILHLMRKPKPQGQHFKGRKRKVENHWEFQPFNWPKSVWGGHHLMTLQRVNDVERDKLLSMWSGTTTPSRQDWREIIEKGRQEGWYEAQFGKVDGVTCEPINKKLVTTIQSQNMAKEQTLYADFIIDATGLDASLDEHPLLKELVDLYQLPPNLQGRLKATHNFEIDALRNGQGRLFAAGIMTLGNRYAPVDSFLGLQYAALSSVDYLTTLKAPGLKKLNGVRSFVQWTRWMRGVSP